MSEKVNVDETKVSVPLQGSDLNENTTFETDFHVGEESNSEISVDTCTNNLVESFDLSACCKKSVIHESLYRNSGNNGIVELVLNTTNTISTNFEEQPLLENELRHKQSSFSDATPPIPHSGIGIPNPTLQESQGKNRQQKQTSSSHNLCMLVK